MKQNYTILTGITPSGSGEVHIGNYFGMVKPFMEMAAKADKVYYFIADLHALTTVHNKQELQQNVENLILSYLAFGVDTDKIIFYRQSDIGVHPELQTILNNITPLSLIKRCHAYKDKLDEDADIEQINMGLFSYPILQAADILLYNPDYIPVGEDQRQHVEITRDIAEFFNKNYGNTFKLPEVYNIKKTARLVGTDGKRKMSKSLGNYISVFGDEQVIKKQIMNCFTDIKRIHPTDPGRVEDNPVFIYHDLINDNKAEVEDLKKRYRLGKVGDVEVKEKLFKAHLKKFASFRQRYNELKQDPQKIIKILAEGTNKAREQAYKQMDIIRDKVGLVNKYSLVNIKQKLNISFSDFIKLDLRTAKIIEVSEIAGADKLLQITLDVGTLGKRTVAAGIKEFYQPKDLIGKTVVYLSNLEPRLIRGIKSEGMIIAAGDKEAILLQPDKEVQPGEIVR